MHNPQWLASFVAVAETGGFTRAAHQLGLTQAAVSQHVRHLENALGPLLLRRPRRVETTPAGAALLAYCQELEQADRRLAARLSDGDARQGEVSLVSPGSVGLMLYPRLLDLQEANPGLVIRHRFAPEPEILDAVLCKKYEMGLVTLKPDDPRLSAQRFLEEPLELLAPADASVKDWDDLQRLGFIDHPDGLAMATRLLARRFPGNPGVRSLPQRGFTNQVSLVLEPVARGLGFTVLPCNARKAYGRPEAIQIVPCHTSVVDTLWLIYRAEWPLSARGSYVVGQLMRAML